MKQDILRKHLAALEYLWWGVSIGGKHYTGEVWHDGKKVELERRLTLREAKEMSEREERRWLRHERVTNKFNTLKQLENAAARWCKANLGDDWLLLEYTTCNPERPIAAAGKFTKHFDTMKELAASWAKVPDSKREGKLWDTVYKAWDAILNDCLK